MTCPQSDPLIFQYTDDDLLLETSTKCDEISCLDSRFDRELQKKWVKSMDSGYFRYRLQLSDHKILPGKFSFFAQLNPDRGSNRRMPQDITSLSQPFNADNFNFTKAKECEIVFKIAKTSGKDSDADPNVSGGDDFLLINVSPLEFCNSLLVPSMYECLPQVATIRSLQLAIDVILLSHTPAMRVGFNSLCGFASVNHLHFHIYYLRHPMILEHINATRLAGPCFELLDYPAKGFVFQLSKSQDTNQLARSVHAVTSHLHASDVAHNVYLTRGSRLDDDPGRDPAAYDTVRVYVWARKSSMGAEEVAGFKPAMCELFGHLHVKERRFYDDLDEGKAARGLADVCDEAFRQTRDAVKGLFDA